MRLVKCLVGVLAGIAVSAPANEVAGTWKAEMIQGKPARSPVPVACRAIW
jgi:hypothetical protein